MAFAHRRLQIIILVLVFSGVLGFVWLRYGTRQVPSGQPALTTIDPPALAAFREEFNSTADRTRVIVLLSPT
jgi:hypothetical protein